MYNYFETSIPVNIWAKNNRIYLQLAQNAKIFPGSFNLFFIKNPDLNTVG